MAQAIQSGEDVTALMSSAGNVDLYAQPKVRNPDGSVSTVDSHSYKIDGKEVLLPSVTPDGRHLKTDGEIVAEYKKTGRHLGKFNSVAEANTYAEQLHNDYAAGKYDRAAPKTGEDVTALMTPHYQTSNEKDAQGNAVVDPNTIGTFASHVGQQLNPVPIGQMIPFPRSAGGAGWDAPLQTVKHLGAAQGEVFDRMKASYAKGDVGGAAVHALNFLIPILGPIFDRAGNEIRAGQVAAGVGDSVGLGLALAGPKGVSNAIEAAKGTETAATVAKAAEKGATERAVGIMAPTTGPNKVRLGNLAAKVAPDVLRETTAHTRAGVLDQAVTKLEEASTQLDAAYDAVPNTRMYPTAPVIVALQKAIRDLSVSGIGGTVEPATRASRIGALRQALAEVKQLGSVMNLDNLRKLKQSWGEGAKAVFTPAVAQDFLKARGEGSGYADANSVLGDYMVSKHPQLADLNANTSLWIKAADVMQAAEEADRVRPRVGRSIMARGLGAAAGGEMHGGWGAVTGAVIGPTIERALMATQPAMKLFVARRLLSLADALRSGQPAKAQSILATFQQNVPRAAAIQAARASGDLALPKAADQKPTQ